MLKAAIEKILEIANPIIWTKDGEDFVVNRYDGVVKQIRKELDFPATLYLNSLDALIKLVKTEASGAEFPLYITVPSHMNVLCSVVPTSTFASIARNTTRSMPPTCPAGSL